VSVRVFGRRAGMITWRGG